MEPKLKDIALQMQEFEASASVKRTGPGERTEGNQFESLVMNFWTIFADTLTGEKHIVTNGTQRWLRVQTGNKSVYLPTKITTGYPPSNLGVRWLNSKYYVTDLVKAYPGEDHVVDLYAPQIGPYQSHSYPQMYSDLTTNFDDVIVLEEAGVLKEKILLEYKTAKSSTGQRVDGNAHERLSFQMMQYLEVATRYPKCSMYVFTNGAFVKYKNKYHVSFHVQTERLSAYSWFEMVYMSEVAEYQILVTKLQKFLLGEND